MIVKGKRTEVSHVDVEIDMVQLLKKMHGDSYPAGAEYLSDGFWYKEDGFDYHKREDLYCKMREATPEEIELHNAFATVIKYVKSGVK